MVATIDDNLICSRRWRPDSRRLGALGVLGGETPSPRSSSFIQSAESALFADYIVSSSSSYMTSSANQPAATYTFNPGSGGSSAYQAPLASLASPASSSIGQPPVNMNTTDSFGQVLNTTMNYQPDIYDQMFNSVYSLGNAAVNAANYVGTGTAALVQNPSALGVGSLQGLANVANGLQDLGVGLTNLAIQNSLPAYVANALGNPLPNITSPDWSNNLFVSNDPAHNISKWLGGQSAATLTTLGASEWFTAGESINPLFQPGPYAGESIPAQSSSQVFTEAERAEINRIGYDTGCHTCGTTNPGTISGNFVPDHQPVSALNTTNASQRLYPQCINCSREQGLAVARALMEEQH